MTTFSKKMLINVIFSQMFYVYSTTSTKNMVNRDMVLEIRMRVHSETYN